MDQKKKYPLIVGVLLFLLAGILYLGQNGGRREGRFIPGILPIRLMDCREENRQRTSEPVQTKAVGETEDTAVYIHICGAVKKPGVYTFKREPRLAEVVKQVGGFTKKADQASVNLAERVADGTQLVISHKGKKKEAGERSGLHRESAESGKVNINTASEQELMTLSGIGESKASQIVSYRETNGAFRQIEEIMNISGIKEGVFSKIKDYITV